MNSKLITINDLCSKGQWDQARKLLDELMNEEGENSQTLNLSASIDVQLNHIEGAIASLEQAIRLDDNDSGLYEHLGIIYFNCGYYEEAMKRFKLGLKCAGENARIRKFQADIYYKQREYEEAKKVYTALLSHAEFELEAKNGLANIARQEEDYDLAIRLYKEVLKHTSNALVKENLGYALLGKNLELVYQK